MQTEHFPHRNFRTMTVIKEFLVFIVLLQLVFSFPTSRVDNGRTRYEFALRFETFPSAAGNSAYAPTQSIKTGVDGNGELSFEVNYSISPENTNYAVWKSVLVNQVGSRWSESGNITFSEGNSVYFASNGMSGYQMGNFDDLQYGTITYSINGGTGLFVDCYGMMVDTFVTLNPYESYAPFEINAWGIFWINSTTSN